MVLSKKQKLGRILRSLNNTGGITGSAIVDRVIAESKSIRLIAKGAGKKAFLVAMVEPTVSLGLVLVEMSKAAKKIKKELISF